MRDALGEALGVGDLGLARILDRRDEVGVLPDRHAVLAPIQPERPARQAFAGIPFALPVMQQAARRKARAQPADQLIGERALGRADGGDVPFRRFHVVDGDEGRLAAHGQAHILRPRSRRPFRRAASSRAQDSSENGLVMRGASRMRLTLISKSNSTLAKPALPETGAAER